MFELDPVLSADTLVVGDLPLCRVLLMNDSQFPWLILVPRRAQLVELADLDDQAYLQFCAESRAVAKAMMTNYAGHKMNIAALGNVVAQLHIHHVVRFHDDPLWPAPIWGKLPAVQYTADEAARQIAELQSVLFKESA
ncbi:HIT domain-containing protein [uncultured Alteromonas sp.]|jgi:diadenosine tetraphosphate (Ap4A) HIT family hydrolase|uniref:HIT domain-containing protein n=1 Tax=uncultured Alteromonas sp. TaxID=179113 RepID=UPI0025D53415|nr:HIT domain-containing protein [uncultured Alteromonas sp.]